MGKWLRRIRGAVGMGLTWAAGWAVGGILIGVASTLTPGLPWNFFFEVFDAPLPALAIPGFVGGALFSVVLGIAGRHRRFDELSVPRFAAWGAVGGLMVSLVPAALFGAGLASNEGSDISLWHLTVVISGPFTFLGAVSAAASLMLARTAQRRELREVGEDVAEAELGEGRQGFRALGTSRESSPASGDHQTELPTRPLAGTPPPGRAP